MGLILMIPMVFKHTLISGCKGSYIMSNHSLRSDFLHQHVTCLYAEKITRSMSTINHLPQNMKFFTHLQILSIAHTTFLPVSLRATSHSLLV